MIRSKILGFKADNGDISKTEISENIISVIVGRGSSVGIGTTGWTVRGSNSGGGEIFRIRPDLPWGPTSLYSGYRVSSGGKAAGAWS
jgi:hypothetical protein